MVPKPVPSPLVGFTRLNGSTYILQPSSSNVPLTDTHAPDLILLCTWLDAAPKHIAKYTSGYSALYPTSTVLLLTTALIDTLSASPSARTARIKPVLDILISIPPGSKVLLHIFSNGGAFTTSLLASAYAAEKGNAGKVTQLPISGMVLDSCPGKPEYLRTHAALALGLPQSPRVYYYFLSFALHVFLMGYAFVKTVTLQADIITVARRDLNNDQHFGKGVPRAYIYSDMDMMVMEKNVEEHAAEAEELGYRVVTERWNGTEHCRHLMGNEGRYWKVVSGLWEGRDGEQ